MEPDVVIKPSAKPSWAATAARRRRASSATSTGMIAARSDNSLWHAMWASFTVGKVPNNTDDDDDDDDDNDDDDDGDDEPKGTWFR